MSHIVSGNREGIGSRFSAEYLIMSYTLSGLLFAEVMLQPGSLDTRSNVSMCARVSPFLLRIHSVHQVICLSLDPVKLFYSICILHGV